MQVVGPNSMAKRLPLASSTKPPTPRRASAARNLIFASGSSGFTRPVGCTWTHSKSIVFPPMTSPILMPSPVQCSPLVVGKCIKSGRYCASKESWVKSAPKPPEQRMTGPFCVVSEPPFSYTNPVTEPELFVSNLWALALVIIAALSLRSAIFSTIWIKAYVMIIPGKRSLPRCVLGAECPPRRATRDRSRLNFSTNQSTSSPLFPHSTFTTSGFFAPPLSVSEVNNSIESGIPFSFCVLVAAPLMPLVALVELPPQNEDLSRSTILPLFSRMVLAADTPAKPPPTTMAVSPMSAPDNSDNEVGTTLPSIMYLAQ